MGVAMNYNSRGERAQARLNRVSPIIQQLVRMPDAARLVVANMPFTKSMIEAGVCPPGTTVEMADAFSSLVLDALGDIALSDAEFELALRLSLPREFRETAQ
jgi:hypothetical protein